MRWLAIACTAVVVVFLCAACGLNRVQGKVLTSIPSTTLVNSVCRFDDPLPHAGSKVSTKTAPSGAVLLWIPGVNQKPCQGAMTHMDAAAALRLADDINRAPQRGGRGEQHCPEDETAVLIFFEFPGRSKADIVHVPLSGCLMIGKKVLTVAIAEDLSTNAPSPWSATVWLSNPQQALG